MDQIFQKFQIIKPKISSSYIKRMGILEFQERILDLITDDMDLIDKMKYIQIVCGNIRNFFIERFVEIRSHDEFNRVTTKIKHIIGRIDELLNSLADNYKLRGQIDNKGGCVIVDYLYHTMQQSYYAEETDIEKIRTCVHALERTDQQCIELSDFNAPTSRYNVIYKFVCPRSFMLVDEYVKAAEILYGKVGKEEMSEFSPESHISELKTGSEFLLRVPYDNYDFVTSFIAGMCINTTIESIWITLYRVNPNDSIVIKYLKEAAAKKKNVFVFVEIYAHGDEINNSKIVEELKQAGCSVNVNYFGYKVHGKMFLAMDRDGKLYGHIGTGNYNEKTARQYTDIHYITGNEEITHEMLNILISLFEKRIYHTQLEHPKIFSSPSNIRHEIIRLINQEICKGKNGRTYIQANNLCDNEISNLLYNAANAGVDVKIICRTSCNLIPTNNIQVRSKAGIYLEHDRIYIFGDKCYIGSADLFYRNLSKRFEIMCEVNSIKILKYFILVWESKPIFELQVRGSRKRWRKINGIHR